MRVKTEERRQAILEKALEVFRELGFDRASMSEISKRIGGSKATLYSYFESKEELFTAAMSVSPEIGSVFVRLADPKLKISSTAELRAELERFSFEHLKLSLRPDIIAMRRNLLAHGDRSDVSKHAFEAGPLKSFMMVTGFIDRMMNEGFLRKDNPWVAMVHLIALNEAELMNRRMLGIVRDISDEMIREATQRSVDVFFRAYGPEKTEQRREAA
jgi:AcrR family transcriptional regulator